MATSRTTGKSYVGQTISGLHNRKRTHKHRCFKEVNDSNKFYNAIRKYGWQDFDWEILATVDKPADYIKRHLDYREKRFIYMYDTYHTGYNGSEGGEFYPILIGQNNPMYGKKRPDLSERNTKLLKGKKLSSEHRNKIIKALIGNKYSVGRKHSEEHKQKTSIAMKEVAKNRLKDDKGRFIRSQHE